MIVRSLALGVVALLSLGLSVAGAQGWSGYYIGLHGGQGWSESETERTISNNTYFAASSITALESASAMSLEEETFTGGAQLGVNWPMGEHFFVGAEIDAAGYGNDTSGAATVVYPCCAPSTFTTTNSLEQTWLATARLRVGVTTEWFMLYGTGGFAGADMKLTQTFADTFSPIAPQTIENAEFRSGYSLGGGVELMIESGTSIRVEYLYLDLGEIEAVGPIATGTTTSTGRAEVTDKLLRAGINFKMN